MGKGHSMVAVSGAQVDGFLLFLTALPSDWLCFWHR